MNYKSVFGLASLSLAAITLGSCLSDSDNTTFANIAAITSFSIDTVKLDAVDQKKTFTIDQVNKKIFNIDSLSFGSEDSIKKILITINATGPVRGPEDKDGNRISVNDSIDLSTSMTTPFVLQVISPADVDRIIDYDVEVRVHQQKPDSLHWNLVTTDFSSGTLTAPVQATWLNGTMHVYDAAGHYFTTTDGKSWVSSTATWPTTPKYTSIRTFGNSLWAVGQDGILMTSTDGQTWTKQDVAVPYVITDLITVLDNKMLILVEGPFDTKNWATLTDDFSIHFGEVAHDQFPRTNINGFEYTTTDGENRAICIGAPSTEGDRTNAWFTLDGLQWSELYSSMESAQLPDLGSRPYVFQQDDMFYTLPTDLSTIYESKESLTWEESDDLVLLPSEMQHTDGAAMAIDAEQRIWLVAPTSGSAPEQVWNGRVNKLGFINQ